jgi:choline kinase
VIINGDIVVEERMARDIICTKPTRPVVLFDSSIKSHGDYNVQVHNDRVVVMSKELSEYHGEYAGITKLDAKSAILLQEGLVELIEEKQYDQWYENVLVQMIFRKDFSLYCTDVSDYRWTEVDTIDDLLLAKQIHEACAKR